MTAYLETFADVQRRLTLSQRVRQFARHTALDALALAAGEAALSRPRVHILYLHHVLADEEASFRALLAELRRSHEFISYSEAVRRIRSGAIDKPALAFSFDDGLRNCLRAAAILEEFGATACFFVCTSMAEPRTYDEQRVFSEVELDLPAAEFLSWGEMEELLRRGHEIGNHSSRHKTLAELSDEQLAGDVGESLRQLRARLGNVEHFAWPRGRFFHFSARAAAAVFNAGHTSCASAERGCHVAAAPVEHALCLRRDQVVAAWPRRHVRYFLVQASRNASPSNNAWPEGWLPEIEQRLR